MSNVFEFVAESRGQSGKVAARSVRRQGNVPAVIYGGHSEPQMLKISDITSGFSSGKYV
ncbi:MAG: large subunit ribosomal protein L25 [Methylococcaceae bacterium NSO1]|nr:MAG: large subunit ribosomal protein L25 [Methylococcaceae bacterium NSO1]